jgi:hypothetical protein
MYMLMEDPLALDDPQPAEKKEPPAPPPPQFAVSEGAERYFGFWIVVLGTMAFLALVALIGFGPR